MDHESLELLSRFLDVALTAEEMQKFERRLLDDPAFGKQVAEWSMMNRHVQELLEESRLHGIIDAAHPSGRLLPPGLQSGNLSTSPFGTQPTITFLPWVISASAVVLGLMWWIFMAPSASDIAVSSPPELPSAATLARSKNVVWAKGSETFGSGDALVGGTDLELLSGMIKLTFECGAETVLEGPCQFRVEGPMRGFLTSGKLIANVPPRAFAFSISTPGVDIADLGTEFGISVNSDETAELHVFSGEVIYRMDATDRDANDLVHVAEAKAVRIDPQGASEISIHIDQEFFRPQLDLRQGATDSPQLPISDGLAFWLSAERGLELDSDGGVVAWHDTLTGDNISGEDALQPLPSARPMFVADSIHGKPAIRFDGKASHLVTTPIESTSDQTVVLVGRFGKTAQDTGRKYGGQILNYDGPPSRELSNSFKPGILQIGEPLLENEFEPTRLTGQVFAGFAGKATLEAGRVDSAGKTGLQPFLLVYRYDHERRLASMWINGTLQGESPAFAPAALSSRKVIGRHAWMELFFHGDLAELMIFNSALSNESIGKLEQHMQDQYGLN